VRDRVERGFDAWIGFLVEEPCNQNRRIDHQAQYLCPSWRDGRATEVAEAIARLKALREKSRKAPLAEILASRQ
jgi:hypothetical protein